MPQTTPNTTQYCAEWVFVKYTSVVVVVVVSSTSICTKCLEPGALHLYSALVSHWTLGSSTSNVSFRRHSLLSQMFDGVCRHGNSVL